MRCDLREILLETKRAGGTNLNTVAAVEAAIADRLIVEGGDHAVETPVGKAQ